MSSTKTETMPATTSPNAQEGFLQKLPEHHVQPLWTAMKAMVTPQPSPKAEVSLWKYNDLRPLLLEAGQAVSSHQAERRVLMLINPSLKAPFTTDSIYAGLQLINPGETAPAHRHRSFALRFIVEGEAGFTAVEGEAGFTAVEGQKLYMQAGDMILTPAWQWHDHGHVGFGPMIWLDGLDLPLYHMLPTHFAEPYSESRHPSKPVTNSTLCFPWKDMQAKLNDQEGSWAMENYRGDFEGYISGTMGAHAEKVKAGEQSPSRRDTCSYIYHVKSGKGSSDITPATGETQHVSWGPHDTFAVPAWSRITHHADKEEDAYLFVLSDRPLIEKLNMYATGA